MNESVEAVRERARSQEIFANRPIRLDRIDWLGFDLDYTLALYKMPYYDALTYDLLIEGLLKLGYPPSLKDLKFDPMFIIKGVCLDIELGNVLKLGKYSQVVDCYHGRQKLTKSQISQTYTAMRIPPDHIGARIELMNTTYDVPKASVFCDVVEVLKSQGHTPDHEFADGKAGPLSYTALWSDILKVAGAIHSGALKKATLDNIEECVHGGADLSVVLDRFRRAGKKIFLLTNSPWFYTNGIMTWLLQGQNDAYASWTDYFDVVIADACKPAFFLGRNEFREIARDTGHKSSGMVTELVRGKVYSGGNHRAFEAMCHITSGDHVLYVGDHIFSDVLISKKRHGWRTFLIIPGMPKELDADLAISDKVASRYVQLTELAKQKSLLFESLDIAVVSPAAPEVVALQEKVSELKIRIKELTKEIDAEFNPYFGGMFRSGLHQSFFAMQVGRYADLYASSVLSFLHYSLLRSFSAPFLALPHEGIRKVDLVRSRKASSRDPRIRATTSRNGGAAPPLSLVPC